MATAPYVFDKENFSGDTNSLKMLYPGDVYDGQPCITVSDEGIFISASKTNVINLTDKYGVHLTGVLSLSATPDQIFVAGGYWTFNPLLLASIPSTSATPIPTLIPSVPPLLQSKSDLSSIVSTLESSLI